MSEHIALIRKKLEHLARMREYLRYSIGQVQTLLPITDWQALQPDQHETLAAFRIRFSEYQEHMGKTMKAIAVEEEKPSEPFTAVLLYMENSAASTRWTAGKTFASCATPSTMNTKTTPVSCTNFLHKWSNRPQNFCTGTNN